MANSTRRTEEGSAAPRLQEGQHLGQREFHIAYDAMPDNYRAELLAGVVREPSPLSWDHGLNHMRVGWILESYAMHTPGLQCADNVTVILSDKDEVQPDVILRIAPECGGQTQNVKLKSRKSITDVLYIKGAPELVAEVACTSRNIDLHIKKQRYTAFGVLEYIVVRLKPERLYWFNLQENRQLSPDANGVFQSEVFPGLWIHTDALFRLDGKLTKSTLKNGLKSKEYKQFASKLKRI